MTGEIASLVSSQNFSKDTEVPRLSLIKSLLTPCRDALHLFSRRIHSGGGEKVLPCFNSLSINTARLCIRATRASTSLMVGVQSAIRTSIVPYSMLGRMSHQRSLIEVIEFE